MWLNICGRFRKSTVWLNFMSRAARRATSPRSGRRAGRKCNSAASSVQANPNKTKQNCLDFLGFIRPNRDFSKGYEQKNKKNRLASQVVFKTSQTLPHSIRRTPVGQGRRQTRVSIWRYKEHNTTSVFRKEIACSHCASRYFWNFRPCRHGRPCAGHPRVAAGNIVLDQYLIPDRTVLSWMAGSSPARTARSVLAGPTPNALRTKLHSPFASQPVARKPRPIEWRGRLAAGSRRRLSCSRTSP
jgi:hypothetical protein